MKTDAIIGVIADLTWPDVRPYAVSLSRCGFEGEKILFVNSIGGEARYHLLRLGFKLVEFRLPTAFEGRNCDSTTDTNAWTGFGQYRYKPVIDFLTHQYEGFRYIIWTDVRDLIFQTDPIAWLEDNLHAPYKLVAARECWKIKNQPHNNQWAKYTAPADYEQLKEEEILCAGAVAGNGDTMLNLFHAIWAASKTLDSRANDQGIFNYLLRRPEYRDITVVPSMAAGWVATAWNTKRYLPFAYSTDDGPVFNADEYIVYTPSGVTPFSMVHQYDRDASWKHSIEAIMEAAQ